MTVQTVIDQFVTLLIEALPDDWTVRDAAVHQSPDGLTVNGYIAAGDTPIVLVFPPPPGNAREQPCDNAGDRFADFDIEWHAWRRCDSVEDPDVSVFRAEIEVIKGVVRSNSSLPGANTTKTKVLFFGGQAGSVQGGETPWAPVKDWPIMRHGTGRVHVQEFVMAGV
jgi:hypothetical protein